MPSIDRLIVKCLSCLACACTHLHVVHRFQLRECACLHVQRAYELQPRSKDAAQATRRYRAPIRCPCRRLSETHVQRCALHSCEGARLVRGRFRPPLLPTATPSLADAAAAAEDGVATTGGPSASDSTAESSASCSPPSVAAAAAHALRRSASKCGMTSGGKAHFSLPGLRIASRRLRQ